jgi:hypothetical protein
MNNQRNSFTRLSSSRISRIAAENAKTDCAAFASLRLCVSQRRDGLRFHRRSFALLLLAMLCWLAPGRAVAAPASGGPLPLPDLLIYGTVVDSNGDALESGTVKVVRNGETLATAEIGAVAGTDYTYLLVVPMGMLPPGSTDSADGVAQAGDTLSFLVDNQPAYFQDSITSLTVNTWQTPSGAAGRGFVLDLSLPGAMRYTLGDVNANGARNAADAMLTLKYDIGLILGVTTFPPGPNTVYLPLCDIVENGRCDSSDALRILQCDVGMTGVTCPVDSIPAGRTGQQPTPGAATRLQVLATAGGEPNTVDVRVLLSADAANFGAASFDLAYDPARFAPVDCVADGAAAFDLVACNQAMAPGRVRFNAVAAAGAADGAEVVAVRFHRLGAAEGDLAAQLRVDRRRHGRPGGRGTAVGHARRGRAGANAGGARAAPTLSAGSDRTRRAGDGGCRAGRRGASAGGGAAGGTGVDRQRLHRRRSRRLRRRQLRARRRASRCARQPRALPAGDRARAGDRRSARSEQPRPRRRSRRPSRRRPPRPRRRRPGQRRLPVPPDAAPDATPTPE